MLNCRSWEESRSDPVTCVCTAAILYLLRRQLPRKFIAGFNSWATAKLPRRRGVTQTLRVWAHVLRDHNLFFFAVKQNYRKCPLAIAKPRLCESAEQPNLTNEKCLASQGNMFTTAIRQQSIKLLITRMTSAEKDFCWDQRLLEGRCQRLIITVWPLACQV